MPSFFARSRRRTLARAGAHTFVFTALALVANTVSGVIVARALGATGRGELTAILVGPNVAALVFLWGASEAIAYHQARHPEDAARLLTAWICFLLPLAAVATGFIQLILPLLLAAQDDETLALARLWAPTVAIAIFGEFFYGFLLGDHDFLAFNLLRLGAPVIVAAGYGLLAMGGELTLERALIVTLIGFGTMLAVAAVRVVRRHGVARPDFKLARASLWYGFKAQGTNLGGIVNARLDLMILPAFLGAASVGLYSVATNLSWIVVTCAGAIYPLVLPVARRLQEQAVRTVVLGLYVSLVVGTLLAAVAAIVAVPAINLVYGREFLGAVDALRLLLPGCVFVAGGQVVFAGLYTMNRPGTAALSQVPGVVITVVGLALFLRPGGIVAAAIVSSVAYGITALVALALFRAVTRSRWSHFVPRRRDFELLQS